MHPNVLVQLVISSPLYFHVFSKFSFRRIYLALFIFDQLKNTKKIIKQTLIISPYKFNSMLSYLLFFFFLRKYMVSLKSSLTSTLVPFPSFLPRGNDYHRVGCISIQAIFSPKIILNLHIEFTFWCTDLSFGKTESYNHHHN